ASTTEANAASAIGRRCLPSISREGDGRAGFIAWPHFLNACEQALPLTKIAIIRSQWNPRLRDDKRANCLAECHDHGVTILSIERQFELSTTAMFDQNEIKRLKVRKRARREGNNEEMKCPTDLGFGSWASRWVSR